MILGVGSHPRDWLSTYSGGETLKVQAESSEIIGSNIFYGLTSKTTEK